MSAGLIGTIVVLILALAVMGGIAYGVVRAKKAVRNFSRAAFGTDSLKEGFAKVEEEYSSTPKSVSAMTNLCLPKIKREFPEFQYDEMKVRAENVLTSYLMAVSAGNVSLLKEGSRELKDKLEMHISMLKGRGEKETFENIKLHRTEIADYKKRNGRCIIIFQISLQYKHVIRKEGGDIVSGSPNVLTQSRYNVELVYIQDRELVEDERDLSLGVNCPNCGAPVSSLGSKICEYCGTPIVELNIYAWTFHNVSSV
ncbi:MAG: zinc-ribbon domain-containing transport protein [Lachnospiraceae bacterium]|nr:zinc-ribbon domain-containing transport protein [Lachnospiraceae bacterium]